MKTKKTAATASKETGNPKDSTLNEVARLKQCSASAATKPKMYPTLAEIPPRLLVTTDDRPVYELRSPEPTTQGPEP